MAKSLYAAALLVTGMSLVRASNSDCVGSACRMSDVVMGDAASDERLGLLQMHKRSTAGGLERDSQKEHSKKLANPYDIVHVPVDKTVREHLGLDVSAQYVNLTNIVVNNLNGQGPGSGPEELRYGNVLTTSGGGSIDLVVTALTNYKPKNKDNNGLNGLLGQISMKGGKFDDFLFRFVEAGTNKSVILNQLLFTFYDVDNAKQSNPLREELFCGHYDKVYLDADTSVDIVERSGSHRPIFRSTVKDNSGFNNPDDPENLSDDQKRHAVTFSFFAISEIAVTFGIPNGKPKRDGRNFFFSGMPLFPSCVDTTETVDLNISETEYVNLGRQGPNASYPEGMRFEDVLTLEGEKVDMLVSVVETPDHEFQSSQPWRSGVAHGFGRINMDRSFKANFSVEFLKSGTQQPVIVKNLAFSFMDLDSDIADANFHERVIAGGFDKVFLSNGTDIQTTDLPDGSTIFSSSTADVCEECNNPTDPSMLTLEQQARTVTLEFAEVSKFHFVVDFTVVQNESIECDGEEESYQLNATDTKCAYQHLDRRFRIEGQTLESCYAACLGTLDCNYFSFSDSGTFAGVCMGCTQGATHVHEPFKFYSMPCREKRAHTLPYTLNKTDAKCAYKHSDRLYRLEGTTLAGCYEECVRHPDCNYFSIDEVGKYKGVCMGCTNGVTGHHKNFKFYHFNKRSRHIYFGGKTALSNAEETEFCTK